MLWCALISGRAMDAQLLMLARPRARLSMFLDSKLCRVDLTLLEVLKDDNRLFV